jgi:hypothetical protein
VKGALCREFDRFQLRRGPEFIIPESGKTGKWNPSLVF